MNGVIAMAGLLLEHNLDSEERELADTIRNCGDNLLTIINDILDFSKIESGKMELESHPFELRLCIEDALDLLGSQASEKDLELVYSLEYSVDDRVIGDVTRLRQVLVNLIGNAIKFTEKGEVVIRIAARKPSLLEDPNLAPGYSYIDFSVADTGVGIPQDSIPFLFQSFAQAEASTTRKFGGTGLGLVISKSLIELMGGNVKVESTVDQGTTVHFFVRVETAHKPDTAPQERPKDSISGHRLLLVDDHPVVRGSLRQMAQRWGIAVTEAACGADALALIKQGETFDVALLDSTLPDDDVLNLAQSLQSAGSSANFPIILLCPIGKRFTAPDPFAGILTKPVKQSQFKEVLLLTLDSSHKSKPSISPRMDRALAERLPLRLLLVDDNVVNQKVAVRMFQQMGYQADVAANGLEALEAIKLKSYDITFMDIQMPQLDGLEATRRLRAIESATDSEAVPLTVIAMTANAIQGDREKCLKAGMDDYLAKPVRPQALQAILENWGSKRPGRSAQSAKKRSPAKAPELAPKPPAAEPNPDVEQDPPVDLARLEDFSSGDPESLRELVTLYLDQTGENLKLLEGAIQQNDAKEVRRISHASGGASATCGMRLMASILRDLEHLAIENRLEGAADSYSNAKIELDRVRKFLIPYL